jgi:hypothetical protein
MFSVFNKGIGQATQFAQSHIFPAMRKSATAVQQAARPLTNSNMYQRNIRPTLFEDYRAGHAFLRGAKKYAQKTPFNNLSELPQFGMGMMKRGFKSSMTAYRLAGSSTGMAQARWAGYGAAGMWGLSGD